MTKGELQEALNRRFSYEADDGESWQIMRGDGPVSGDCEDYSLTLIWMFEARSMVRFWWSLLILRYVIWYALLPNGEGHAVVWCRGLGWTDNIQRQFVSRETLKDAGYTLRFPYPILTVALKFVLRRVRAFF